jgi:hypothetical protein
MLRHEASASDLIDASCFSIKEVYKRLSEWRGYSNLRIMGIDFQKLCHLRKYKKTKVQTKQKIP